MKLVAQSVSRGWAAPQAYALVEYVLGCAMLGVSRHGVSRCLGVSRHSVPREAPSTGGGQQLVAGTEWGRCPTVHHAE